MGYEWEPLGSGVPNAQWNPPGVVPSGKCKYITENHDF